MESITIGAPHIRQRIYWFAVLPFRRLVHPKFQRLEGYAGYEDKSIEPGRKYSKESRPITKAGCEFHWSEFYREHCLDGRSRRIKSRLQLLVDGIPGRVGAPRETNQATEKGLTKNAKTPTSGSNQALREMRLADDKDKDVWTSRGHDCIQEEKILQPGVHGRRHDWRDQGFKREEQLQAVGQGEGELLCGVRIKEIASCPPRRPEPAQQQPIQFEDVVRAMPQAYALATIEQDIPTLEKLLTMFPSSSPQRTMQHTLLENAKAWRPPSSEEVERAWNAGHFKSFIISRISPTSRTHPARKRLLIAYGNAICPPLAAEFILACVEAYGDFNPHSCDSEEHEVEI